MVLNLILLLLTVVAPFHAWTVGERLYIADSYSMDSVFDGDDMQITCYYSPSSYMSEDMNVQLVILRNDYVEVVHRLSPYDNMTNNNDTDGWYQDDIYVYTYTLYDFYHTDNVVIYYQMNDDADNSLGLITYTTFSVSTRNINYYDGYQQGVSDGYNSGYNSGYAQGQIDYTSNSEYSDGVITRMWDIFASAGAVVLNVFSMNVLPGIPLYMLIFFPVLIAIIIFIIRSLSK